MLAENRSWLFVPADDERKVQRGATSGADALILDLEDAIVPERRHVGRALVRDALASWSPAAPQAWVRTNPLDTDDALVDLAAVVRPNLAGIVLPKARTATEVARLDHYLTALEAREGMVTGTVHIMVVATETPEMVLGLGSLSGASPRLHSCTWGAEDLATALGAMTNKADDGGWDDPYQLARSLCLLAARAAGAQPVDTLFSAFQDDDGLADSVRHGRRQGFTGKVAIHPRQVPIINDGFTPSMDEVGAARRIVAAFAERSGAGAVSLDGRMLDRPHLVQATQVLARADASVTDQIEER